jgi:drug/metabolite transporter (DMT)-like permease
MDNINWRLLIVIYILLTGVWGTLIKVASDRLNPLTMSFIVSTSAWLTVAAVALPRLDFQNKTGVWIAAVCGLMGGFLVIIFYTVLKQAPASVVIPVSTLYVLVTVVLSYFFLGEAITIKQLAGIVLGLVSIYLLTS